MQIKHRKVNKVMTQEEKDNIYNWLYEHINKDTSIIYSCIVSINYDLLMKKFKDLLNKM